MQAQEIERNPNYHLVVEFNYTPIQEYYLPSPPIPTGNISQTTAMLSLNENRLASVGMLLASMLAYTLDQLRAYNERAIYPIMSILEPYMKATEELDLRMPPLSSRRVTINVTDRGRAKPDLSIE
jgi:hypothetical protein